MAFEGVSKNDYPQDIYSIFSILCDKTPPPSVHFHLQCIPIKEFEDVLTPDEELLDVSPSKSNTSSPGSKSSAFINSQEKNHNGKSLNVPSAVDSGSRPGTPVESPFSKYVLDLFWV